MGINTSRLQRTTISSAVRKNYKWKEIFSIACGIYDMCLQLMVRKVANNVYIHRDERHIAFYGIKEN